MLSQDNVIGDLLKLAGQIPKMTREFEEAGFLLPKITSDSIEESRVRNKEEMDYVYHYTEIQKELIGLYGIEGLPNFGNDYKSLRQHSAYKSNYIEWLIPKLDVNEFGFKDTAENEILLKMCMDPSYIMENQLAHEDISYAKQRAKLWSEERKREIEVFSSEISKLTKFPRVFSFNRVIDLIESVIMPLGFTRVKINKKGGSVFHKLTLREDLIIWHGYENHQSMSKGNSWPIYLGFSAPDYSSFSLKSKNNIHYYSLKMVPFSHSGSLYTKHFGRWNEAVLGIIAHGEMLKIVLKHWREIDLE